MSALLELWSQGPALIESLPRPHHAAAVLADGTFPDPPPVPLPEKAQNGVNTFLGMGKTLLYVCAVAAGLFVSVGMVLGARGRSNYAKDAVMHFPWIFGGLISAASLVGLFDMLS